MRKTIIIDLKTTGNSPTDRICQLSFLVMNDEGLLLESYCDLCTSPAPMSIDAMAIHHITPERLKGFPKLRDTIAFKQLTTLNTRENLLITHDSLFDFEMLKKENFTLKMPFIDTYRVLRAWYPQEPLNTLQYKRYQWGLYHQEQPLIEKLGVKNNSYETFGDAITLKLLYDKIVQEHSVDSMVELCSKPILLEYVPFGEHKGKRFSDIVQESRKDLEFIYDVCTLDEDIRHTIEHYLHNTPSPVQLTNDAEHYQGRSSGEITERVLMHLEAQKQQLLESTNALIHLTAKLEQVSYTDMLTETFNRRYFNLVYEREFKRALRSNSMITLMIIGIDFFKHYNDTYGHLQGNIVLQSIANALKTSLVRPGDFISRLEGEKFGIILTETDCSNSRKMGERLRLSVESLKIEYRSNNYTPFVTVSIGAVCLIPTENMNNEILFKTAMNNLATAKDLGSNRAIFTTTI